MKSQPEIQAAPEDVWVRDEPRVRGFDGKTLEIKGRGVFTMSVVETGQDGVTRKDGHVRVLIEPHDLNAALSTLPK